MATSSPLLDAYRLTPVPQTTLNVFRNTMQRCPKFMMLLEENGGHQNALDIAIEKYFEHGKLKHDLNIVTFLWGQQVRCTQMVINQLYSQSIVPFPSNLGVDLDRRWGLGKLKVFLYASVFSIVIIGCILLIGLSLFIKMPSLAPGVVYDYLLANVPPYVKGLMGICLLAMAMSTADSKLHTSSILMSYDILSHIGWIRMRRFNRFQLLLAHIATLATSILAMALACHKGFAYS